MKVATLIQQNSIILYQIPPGKPNGDMHHRIVQPPCKSGVNWYYTLNFLRERHQTELTGREIEAFFSQYRKKCTQYTCDFQSLANIKKQLRHLTPLDCREMLDDWPNSLLGKIDENLQNLVRSFAFNTKGISNFFTYIKKYLFNLDLEVLAHFNIDPESYYNAHFPGFPSWSELTPVRQHSYIQSMVFLTAVEKYGLQCGAWKPDQPIETLITSLLQYGPHYVHGPFSSACYYGSPAVIKELGGRKIYGWIPGFMMPEAHDLGTAVLIVGAEKRGVEEFVFFIDCMDMSDPEEIESQKIYEMSYAFLCLRVADLYGHRQLSQFPYTVHKSSHPNN